MMYEKNSIKLIKYICHDEYSFYKNYEKKKTMNAFNSTAM